MKKTIMAVTYQNLLDRFRPHKFYRTPPIIGILQFILFAGFWFFIIYALTAITCILFSKFIPDFLYELKFFGLAQLIYYLAPIISVLVLIPLNALFLVLNERKLLALL